MSVRIPDDPAHPDTLAQLDRWFTWNSMLHGDEPTKKPVAPYETDHLYPVSWKNYDDKGYGDPLTSLDTVRSWVDAGHSLAGHYDYPEDSVTPQLGFAFVLAMDDEYPLEQNPVLIDFDDARDPETGETHWFVQEFIEAGHTYCQYSNSGDVHGIGLGTLPDDVGSIDAKLPEDDRFPDAKLEVYDHDRFVAMTGDHIEGTPTDAQDVSGVLEEWADEFVTTPDNKPGSLETEPDRSREQIESMDDAMSVHEVFDAIQHTKPRDIRIDSPATNKRSDSISRDPTWARSESGTRLAQVEGGFVYRQGMVGLDCLQLVALEEGIISDEGEYPEGDDFWDAVDALRDRGAPIPEYDPDNHTEYGDRFYRNVILPRRSDVASVDTPDTPISKPEVHDRVYREIEKSIENGRNTLIDAIMGSGKTYSSFQVAADKGEPITYLAPRIELYEQGKEYALENGIPEDEILILPSMKRDCPTWQGEHGDEWESRVKRQYYDGAEPKAIHALNDDIPCQEHGDTDKCPYEELWDVDFSEYQVIIGHYKHAHVVPVTVDRTVIFDEEPSDAFCTGLYGDELIGAVNTFLSFAESPPADDFDDLLAARRDTSRVDQIAAWFQSDAWNWEPDSRNVVRLDGDDDPYHAYAPFAVFAIATATPIADGSNFERSPLPEAFNDALFFTTDDQHPEYYVEVRSCPDLFYADTILALDGTPLIDDSKDDPHRAREWNTAVGEQFHHARILSDEERSAFVSETLNHTYIQTSQYRKPYSSGQYNNAAEDAALCAAVTEEFGNGTPPVVLSSKSVVDEYRDRGFEEAGIVREFDYSGNLRGTDKYGDCRLGVKLGSSHHGDHELSRRAAWLRESVSPDGRGNDRDYGTKVGNLVHEQMAEKQTLQEVMRFGRDGDGATIIVHTSAIPDWLPIQAQGSVEGWGDGKRQVVTAVSELSGAGQATTTDIANHSAVTVSRRQVLNILNEFGDRGLVKKDTHPDDARKRVWEDAGLGSLSEHEQGDVELPEIDVSETTEQGDTFHEDENLLYTIYTSNFVNSTRDTQTDCGGGGSQTNSGGSEGDPPDS
jgi:hypothetical protein